MHFWLNIIGQNSAKDDVPKIFGTLDGKCCQAGTAKRFGGSLPDTFSLLGRCMDSHSIMQRSLLENDHKTFRKVPKKVSEGSELRLATPDWPVNSGLLHTAPIREVPLVAKGGQEEKLINHYVPLVTETVVRKLLLFFLFTLLSGLFCGLGIWNVVCQRWSTESVRPYRTRLIVSSTASTRSAWHVPAMLRRLYANQSGNVGGGRFVFNITREVKQRDVLSPTLFNSGLKSGNLLGVKHLV